MGENTDAPGTADRRGETVPEQFASDEFYAALAARPRRRVLYRLFTSGAESVGELATFLAGWEATTGSTMVTPETHRRWRSELVHLHLPKLAEAGLVEYDRERGTVELADLGERVADVVRWSIRAEGAKP